MHVLLSVKNTMYLVKHLAFKALQKNFNKSCHNTEVGLKRAEQIL